ncbi:MAG: threonine/serine dehydratase [Chloroflexi bacterium]|nr:threonine/serine dehydratase [Chloroflexota bacterium]MBP8056611.1 threonine/serine dehydratase [Chloroflexota bacterium]
MRVSLSLADIQATRTLIDPYIVTTPVWLWRGRELSTLIAPNTQVFLKLELWQYTGTFKPRGALANVLSLDETTRLRGFTAVSAGNHAIALAYAAQIVGSHAKVVMPQNANPARVALCRAYGADVELVANVHEAFDRVEQIQQEEGRRFIHPFEGRQTALGTATLGLELAQQLPDLDAVIVPIGGGGLIAGIAAAIKQLSPSIQVYGVEPEGADSMFRSLQSGQPEKIEAVRTIADSLGAPYALPYSFALCQQFVDEVVLVNDDQLKAALALLFREMKLAVEPAGAAATAALIGPLRQRLQGKRVALIVCGTNIDTASYTRFLLRK